MIKRFSPKKLILRSGEGPVLEGYGFAFSETTEDGCFGKERFSRDVKIDYAKKCFLLRDHDRSKVIGRRGQNLKFSLDNEGLHFEVSKLPKTPLAEETRELIKEGLVNDCSIGFLDIESEVNDGVTEYRHIELHELSILPLGYFESGKVSARNKKEKPYYPPEILF